MAQQTQQFLQNYLNNARKAHRHKTEDEPDDKSKASDTKNDDDWLTKLVGKLEIFGISQ